MTSTHLLKRRYEMAHPTGEKIWSYHSPEEEERLQMSGREDTYLINGAHRECHPDYMAIPIDDKYGMMVCKRMRAGLNDPRQSKPTRGRSGKSASSTHRTLVPTDAKRTRLSHGGRGYFDRSASLYDPYTDEPRRSNQPYPIATRGLPNEDFLVRNDYLARDFSYNGTGVPTSRDPLSNGYTDIGRYSQESRTARRPEHLRADVCPTVNANPPAFAYTTRPPPKYDIHRLNQAYPVWRNEQERMGISDAVLDRIDQEHRERWV